MEIDINNFIKENKKYLFMVKKDSLVKILIMLIGLLAAVVLTIVVPCSAVEKFVIVVIEIILFVLFIYNFLCYKFIYSEKVKLNIIAKLIKSSIKNSNYFMEKMINQEKYYNSGLFKRESETLYSGNDYIEYKNDFMHVVTSDLNVVYYTGSGKKRKMHTQFSGRIFENNFLDKLSGENFEINYEFSYSSLGLLGNVIMFILIGFFMSIILSVFMKNYNGVLFGMFISGIITLLNALSCWKSDKEKKNKDLSFSEEIYKNCTITGCEKEAKKYIEVILKEIFIKKQKDNFELKLSKRNNRIYLAITLKEDIYEIGFFKNLEKSIKMDFRDFSEIIEINNEICKKVYEINNIQNLGDKNV